LLKNIHPDLCAFSESFFLQEFVVGISAMTLAEWEALCKNQSTAHHGKLEKILFIC